MKVWKGVSGSRLTTVLPIPLDKKMKKRLMRREEDTERGGILFFTKCASVGESDGNTKARERRKGGKVVIEVKKEEKKIGGWCQGEVLFKYVCVDKSPSD